MPKAKKNKRKKKILGGGNCGYIPSCMLLGFVIIFAIVVLWVTSVESQQIDMKKPRKVKELDPDVVLIAKLRDLKSDTNVKIYKSFDDSTTEIQAYESPDVIVLARARDIEDPLYPVVMFDKDGTELAVPFAAIFLKPTELVGEYTVNVPLFDSIGNATAWIKKKGYAISEESQIAPIKAEIDINAY